MFRRSRLRLLIGVLVLVLVLAVAAVLIGSAARERTDEVAGGTPPAPTALTVNHLIAPMTVEVDERPRLSWQVPAGEQASYQVTVGTAPGLSDVWDSGRVVSTGSTDRVLSANLAAGAGYHWRVRTWNAEGVASAWSEYAHFGTGPGQNWPEATPIWVNAGPTWRDYSYEGTFVIEQEAIGLVFRAVDSDNFQLWQFRTTELVQYRVVEGIFHEVRTVPLPQPLAPGTPHTFRIQVSGAVVTTELDGEPIDTTTIEGADTGAVGVRTGGAESGRLSAVSVIAEDGTELRPPDGVDLDTSLNCGAERSAPITVPPRTLCLSGLDWTDHTVDATVRIDAVAASLVLRASDNRHYYLWQLTEGSPGRLVTTLRRGHEFLPVQDEVVLDRPVLAGVEYRLRVEMTGSTFRTYLDEELINTVDDSSYRAGTVGLRSGSVERFRVSDLTATRADGSSLGPSGRVNSRTGFSCVGDDGDVPSGTSCFYNADNNWAFLRGETATEPGKEIAWAHLYATASSTAPTLQHVYKLWVNGSFVGVGPSRPVGGWTRYDGYDVTALVRSGEPVAVGALAYTPSDRRFQAMLVIGYTDGTRQRSGTGSEWRVLPGEAALPSAGSVGTAYYDAPRENFDARAYPFGFHTPGFDDSGWEVPTERAAFGELRGTPTANLVRSTPLPVSAEEVAPGEYRLDYGRTLLGGLSLQLNGAAGDQLELTFGPLRRDDGTVMHILPGGNNYRDVWTLRDGPQQLETWGLRVFRYVDVTGAPSGLTGADFPAYALVQPAPYGLATFHAADPDLVAVWQLSADTVVGTNGNLYVDTWERERAPYEADAYLQLLANLATSGDATLGTFSLEALMPTRTWPTEWPLQLILAVREAYRHTGDLAAVERNYSGLVAKLPGEYFDAEIGLVGKNFGNYGNTNCIDCDLVDWPLAERDDYVFGYYNTVINAFSFAAYGAMAELADALGYTADARRHAERAATIRDAMNTLLWDDAAGAYRDGLTSDRTPIDHHALQAGVFTTAFGVPEAEQLAAAVDGVVDRQKVCSVYCTAFLVQGMYLGGRADAAHDVLVAAGPRSWRGMIDRGAGSTLEAWNESLKQNLSYSHPWGASPAYAVPWGMFGIAPTSAGYATLRIAPQVDRVDWADYTQPTVRGPVGVAYQVTSEATVALQVSIPGNSTAQVRYPVPDEVDPRTVTVYLDGARIPAEVVDGGLLVRDVGPGCHTLYSQPGEVRLVGPADVCAAPGGPRPGN